MNVTELIKRLQAMPPDAEVEYAWDGCLRATVKYIWLARDGNVGLSDGDVIFYDDERPIEAPSEKEVTYWKPTL